MTTRQSRYEGQFCLRLPFPKKLQLRKNHLSTTMSRKLIVCCLLLGTISCDANRLRVLVLGDWGQELTSSSRPFQERVARSLGTYLEDNSDIAFIVSTGDNFYCCGVTSPSDIRFQNTWEDIYRTSTYPVMKSLRWYISVGNHDHTDDFNELHQIAFGNMEDDWYFPSLWYDFIEDVGDFKVHFVVTDTQSLRRNKHNRSAQGDFIEEKLRDSTADYVIVVGHHPGYNAGYHGGSSTVRRYIIEQMNEHKADIYIMGHDHNLQHINPSGAGSDSSSYIDHVLTGGGGRRLYELDLDNLADLEDRGQSLRHFEHDFGFIVLDFNQESMEVEYFTPANSDGNGYQKVYSFNRPNFRQGLFN